MRKIVKLMIKSIAVVLCACVMLGIVGCSEIDKRIISVSTEIESQFDLTQEKYWWSLRPDEEFTDSEIMICFKKTETYPELSVEVFHFYNAKSIEYIALRPSGGKYENTEHFTQIAVVHLKEPGRDKVIEAVKYFQRISIIKSAEPNGFMYAD